MSGTWSIHFEFAPAHSVHTPLGCTDVPMMLGNKIRGALRLLHLLE